MSGQASCQTAESSTGLYITGTTLRVGLSTELNLKI